MAPRESGGWALTCRQEVHPDDFGPLEPLLTWLRARAVAFHCHLRFYEDDAFEPLAITDGGVRWP
jgi:hypothetical protein